MTRISRRNFMALTAGAAALGACGGRGLLAADATAGAQMSIARWTGGKDLKPEEIRQAAVRLTEKAIEAIGGMKRFVSAGSVVWVKPNIAWDRKPELAANTNPDVVATIVRLCLAAGAKKVKVGDNPCHAAQKTYASSGIADAAKEAGAEVVFLDKSRFKDMAINGEKIKTLPVYPEIIETDLVINVPVVKHHVLAKTTICMKNYMGVIEKRNTLHQDLGTCIADLTRFMKPRLCVMDAVRILTARGPTGGNPADVKLTMTVAAGTDIVALDALGAEIMGLKPADIPSIVKGEQYGLGKMDYKALSPVEMAVS